MASFNIMSSKALLGLWRAQEGASLNSADLEYVSSIIRIAGHITSVPHTNPFPFPEQKGRELNGITKAVTDTAEMWNSFSLLMHGALQDNFATENSIVFSSDKAKDLSKLNNKSHMPLMFVTTTESPCYLHDSFNIFNIVSQVRSEDFFKRIRYDGWTRVSLQSKAWLTVGSTKIVLLLDLFWLQNRSSHPCLRKYRVSGWWVSKIRYIYLRDDFRYLQTHTSIIRNNALHYLTLLKLIVA